MVKLSDQRIKGLHTESVQMIMCIHSARVNIPPEAVRTTTYDITV